MWIGVEQWENEVRAVYGKGEVGIVGGGGQEENENKVPNGTCLG